MFSNFDFMPDIEKKSLVWWVNNNISIFRHQTRLSTLVEFEFCHNKNPEKISILLKTQKVSMSTSTKKITPKISLGIIDKAKVVVDASGPYLSVCYPKAANRNYIEIYVVDGKTILYLARAELDLPVPALVRNTKLDIYGVLRNSELANES